MAARTAKDKKPNTARRRPGRARPKPERLYPKGEIRVSDSGIRDRLSFLGLTEEDLGVLASWKEPCFAGMEAIVDQFYAYLLGFSSPRQIVEERTTVAKQRPLLTRYLHTLVTGVIDDEYLEYRKRVGIVHETIDLDASWYVGMYRVVQDALTKVVSEAGASAVEVARFGDALHKVLQADIALCLSALMDARQQRIEDEQHQQQEQANIAANELNRLTQDIQQGKLDTRGDAQAYQGSWAEIIGGVNGLIDAFVAPINVTAEYVERISKGDIPEKITDEYRGDFNEIKNNLNGCIDVTSGLLEETRKLVDAATAGELDTRGDANRFEGDWGVLVAGVNGLIDAFVAPINVTAEYVERISKGDIPEKITDEYRGDFNEIKNSLNACIDNLNAMLDQTTTLIRAINAGDLTALGDASALGGAWAQVVKGINEMIQPIHDGFSHVTQAVAQIASASGQVASSSQQVAEGASEQASALEETSSSLEEMEAMTKQNADNAQQARALAEEMKDLADTGSGAMGRLLEGMNGIRQSAEGTAAIIKDINEIAFQTNLLALNAAVEAARAGDAGRGFAVVAEEVRNLALRAKEAAQRTESLINESVKLSGEGSTLSAGANENLEGIVTSVQKVTDIIGEIAAASEEQARGIVQVNKAVTEMDKVVQQAAANSEETASASEELSGQSEDLAAMVGRFQLDPSRSPATLKNAASEAAPQRRVEGVKRSPSRSAASMSNAPDARDVIPFGDDEEFAEF